MAGPTKAELLARVAALERERAILKVAVATAERTATEAVEHRTATSEILKAISAASLWR